jgi:hypothetical protein
MGCLLSDGFTSHVLWTKAEAARCLESGSLITHEPLVVIHPSHLDMQISRLLKKDQGSGLKDPMKIGTSTLESRVSLRHCLQIRSTNVINSIIH